MFEPQKFITVGLAALLLAPFAFVFWQIARYQPRPETEIRAELEKALRESTPELGTVQVDGSYLAGVGVWRTISIGFSESTARWLSFFPHRWVGVCGLIGVVSVFVCVVVSLFYAGGPDLGVNQWATPEGEIPR
ncbi:MAG TPA: hypothetical protein VMZ27_05680 [Candidatus Saccharimonadales bacterium]|nr:hypothetical protein [Candidatus Saccharimonadales bacterium]